MWRFAWLVCLLCLRHCLCATIACWWPKHTVRTRLGLRMNAWRKQSSREGERATGQAGQGLLCFTHRTAYLCTIHSPFITGSLIIAMPSLISTAIALPLSLTLVLLPPLLQIDARNVNSNPPTLASFVSAILDKTSYEPIASRVQNGVGRLLSYWFTFSLTNQQRATVLRFEEQFPGLFAACGLALLGLWATSLAIERTKETFKARGFKGRDLLKPQSQNEM